MDNKHGERNRRWSDPRWAYDKEVIWMTIKEVTPTEHREWCEQQIKENGLYGAVKEQLDEIVLDSRSLGYADHGDVMLRCQNILDLVEVFGQKCGIYRVEQRADNITNIKNVGVLNL